MGGVEAGAAGAAGGVTGADTAEPGPGRAAGPPPVPPVLAAVPGQPRAVTVLAGAVASGPVHAYLFVGPPGSGREEAARAFAAAVLCPDGGCGACSVCRRVLGGAHPDVVAVERTGASISVDEARQIIRAASRSPVEARRKVLVLNDFHLVDRAAPALLKTVEEPPPTTVFVILADAVTPELVTIASRCVRVDFGALSVDQVSAVLADDGVEPELAARAAAASGGRIDRARLLVRDDSFADRQATWAGVPGELDGTGATVSRLCESLLAGIEAAGEPLRVMQQEEAERLAREAEARGEKLGKDLEDRHRRQQRRLRADEIKAGLAALAGAYRDRLAAAPDHEVDRLVGCLAAVEEAGRALERNVNEALLLQSLLVRLGDVSSDLLRS
ncbi:MAG TPA: hypothetical protein VFH45_04540 [Acidimicrobiales bacterium]|nr:hypothetical protein [Acidimicrobiales bacterium]